MSIRDTVVAESSYGERLRLQGSRSSRPAVSATHRPARVFLCATCPSSRYQARRSSSVGASECRSGSADCRSSSTERPPNVAISSNFDLLSLLRKRNDHCLAVLATLF